MANMDFFIILQPLTHALIEDETRNSPHINRKKGVRPNFPDVIVDRIKDGRWEFRSDPFFPLFRLQSEHELKAEV
jgi:hypothetical protein